METEQEMSHPARSQFKFSYFITVEAGSLGGIIKRPAIWLLLVS